jgi:aspartyl-tRNA(Asn)/glutamyl-tRNA(Gln) amidotransferase subunit B
MEKGLLRIEPNISVRPVGSERLGTRVEVKNLNSFRALERSVDYEIQRQIQILREGGVIQQETVGWDENQEVTFSQRVKEAEDDYRYFPEPDLPPLVLDPAWIQRIRDSLPELPDAKLERFIRQYDLRVSDAQILVSDQAVATYFEGVLADGPEISPKVVVNWVTGELFGLLNLAGVSVQDASVSPDAMRELIQLVEGGEINQNTGKTVLAEMFSSGERASDIITARDLGQISDEEVIAELVRDVLTSNPDQVASYRAGKIQLAQWLFGQVMRATKGRANPQIVQAELTRQLDPAKKLD